MNQSIPPVDNSEPQPGIRSLRELLDLVSGRSLKSDAPQEESGLAENRHSRFLAWLVRWR
jgi:hypothetical protein